MRLLQVQEYKGELIKKAETLIMTGFPEKIVQLNEILETPMFADRNFQDVHQVIEARWLWLCVQKRDFRSVINFRNLFQALNIPIPNAISLNHVGDTASKDDGAPANKRARVESNSSSAVEVSIASGGSKVLALPSGTVNCNVPICDIIKIVKPVIRALVEDSNLLKMWISFLIPKIEDGNNFGVSVQEDTLGEIQSVESEAAAFFDQISRYFISRAKIVSKVAKYPHIEDYRRAVQVMTLEKKKRSNRMFVISKFWLFFPSNLCA